MTGTDRSVTTVSARIAIGGGAITTLLVAIWHWLAFLLAAIGIGCLAVGLFRGSRTPLGFSLGWFALAVVVAGAVGAPTEIALGAMVTAVLAWDAGRRAISLGEQLGRTATTARIEIIHAAANGFVGVCTIAVAYLLSVSLSVSYPPASILLLCASVVTLLFAHRSHP